MCEFLLSTRKTNALRCCKTWETHRWQSVAFPAGAIDNSDNDAPWLSSLLSRCPIVPSYVFRLALINCQEALKSTDLNFRFLVEKSPNTCKGERCTSPLLDSTYITFTEIDYAHGPWVHNCISDEMIMKKNQYLSSKCQMRRFKSRTDDGSLSSIHLTVIDRQISHWGLFAPDALWWHSAAHIITIYNSTQCIQSMCEAVGNMQSAM